MVVPLDRTIIALLLAASAAVDTLSAASAAADTLSVYCDDSLTCRLSSVHDKTATVMATYNKSTNLTSGFATLDIVSPAGVEPRLAAFGAGFAEGYQTADEIALFYNNVYEFGPRGPSKDLVAFVEDNDAWVRAQAKEKAAMDDYWTAVALVMTRFDGTVAGYAKAAAERADNKSAAALPPLGKLEFLWINLDGDLYDLQRAIGDTNSKRVGRLGRAARLLVGNESSKQVLRCSSLFKLTEDKSDVYFGHATWDTYATAAPRIFKHLTLPAVHGAGRGASHSSTADKEGTTEMVEGSAPSDAIASPLRTISMSSSPGFMSSIDDYYLVGEPSHAVTLGVIETSISIEDDAAYSAITPKSVLCWVRAMAANQVAMDAPSWATAFATHASGTYNNQWLVLDVAKAKAPLSKAAPLLPDTFVVLEEVPGLVHSADQTPHLNTHGYWASFNAIYYPETRKIAGARGSYDGHVRYKLFEELQGGVTSGAAMRRVMAWNDYKHDPGHIAHGPSDAIMSRGDLGSWGGDPGGGIDAKISSVTLASEGLGSWGRAGPTNDDQPTFCWAHAFRHTPHAGHPHCYDFEWAAFRPK